MPEFVYIVMAGALAIALAILVQQRRRAYVERLVRRASEGDSTATGMALHSTWVTSREYMRIVRAYDGYQVEVARQRDIAAQRDAEHAARHERMMASLAQAPPSMNVPAGLYARPGRLIPVDDNADRVISVSPYDRPWVSDVLIPAPVGPRGPEQEAELARQAAAPQIPLDELVANTKTEDRTRYWIARKR